MCVSMDSICFLWNYRFLWIGNVHWMGYTNSYTGRERERKRVVEIGRGFAPLCHLMSMTFRCVFVCIFPIFPNYFSIWTQNNANNTVYCSCMNLLHKHFTSTFFFLFIYMYKNVLRSYCHNRLSTKKRKRRNRQKKWRK